MPLTRTRSVPQCGCHWQWPALSQRGALAAIRCHWQLEWRLSHAGRLPLPLAVLFKLKGTQVCTQALALACQTIIRVVGGVTGR